MSQATQESSQMAISAPRLLVNDLPRHVAPLADEVARCLARVVASGWFILGREVSAFEEEFAAYLGVPHCVGVASGSDALELALRAVGVETGDDVLTVANAGGYASIAILAVGATPLYVDVDPQTLLVSITELENTLARLPAGSMPRAVIVTHLYGQIVDVSAIRRATERFGISIIEDCAQAHGGIRDGRRCGGLGDASAFSFYPTKNLGALGDGGAVTTADRSIADRVRALRQYGWSTKYLADLPGGRNSRLDEFQAAILRLMLPHLDSWNHRRNEIAATYRRHLSNHPRLTIVGADREGDVNHLFVIRSAHRLELQRMLADHGICSEIHYPVPDHEQPAVRGRLDGTTATSPLVETAMAAGEVLSLPCFPEMDDDDVRRVIRAVSSW